MDAQDNVTVKTTNGEVKVENNITSHAGDISVTSRIEDITITSSGVLTAGEKVSLHALTAGDIKINNDITGKDIEIKTENGDIVTDAVSTLTATTEGGTITVGVIKGDITLRGVARADQKVEVEAATGSVAMSNAVESENGEVAVTAQKDITSSAAINAGTNVTLSSTNGEITSSGAVTAGQKVEVETAEGNVILNGTVTSANGDKCSNSGWNGCNII